MIALGENRREPHYTLQFTEDVKHEGSRVKVSKERDAISAWLTQFSRRENAAIEIYAGNLEIAKGGRQVSTVHPIHVISARHKVSLMPLLW